MKEETKWLLGIGVLTLLVIGAIAFYYGKNNPSAPAETDLLIREDSQTITAASSTVTLVEFGDYECPACATIAPLVESILKEYEGRLTFVFRNFPLVQHTRAIIAAEAAETAADQGKFWEMNKLLYQKQNEWVASENPESLFAQYATELGMNAAAFSQSLADHKYADKIQRDTEDGRALNIAATPTFFINGERLVIQQASDLKNAIDEALKGAQ